MLTFFRRIRKGLLGSGQARKYLLYAIGEIALVVIGILIALQINNRNEWRKDRMKETIILQNMAETLESNIITLEESIEWNEQINESADTILNRLQTSQEFPDSILWRFRIGEQWGCQLHLSKSGYEELKNVGFDIIVSDSLKNNIINLFEVVYLPTEEVMKTICQQEDSRYKDFRLDNFDLTDRGLRPVDIQSLSANRYYREWHLDRKGLREVFIGWLSSALLETERVLQLIKEELGQL